ncbi:MAG: hypothetical protein LBJ98_04460 [Endomicrobium sp.]|jgi:hypothetical protein|nr:hypothetical protein [Endomicrobium sp.]
MKYENMIFKKPIESKNYESDSKNVIAIIKDILQERIKDDNNKIIINTNLKYGLPLENINKIAGSIIEAWCYEVFSKIYDIKENKYQLINIEAQSRLGIADIVLQFKKPNSHITANVDVKATAEDIKSSGKSPNITPFSRIRTAYVEDPDFMFIILSIKHKVYSQKNCNTNLIDSIMEIVGYNAYDLKFISDKDISYNPALGSGQLQIKDIYYISFTKRTTWEFCQLLDTKYLKSSKKSMADWYKEAKKNKWIK